MASSHTSSGSQRALSPYSPPREFWQEFYDKHWEKSEAAFRCPISQPLMTPEEGLAIYQGLSAKFRSGQTPDLDIYVESGLVRSGIADLLPSDEDTTLDAYLARATRKAGGQGITLVTNNVRSQSTEHFRRSREFARGLVELIGAGSAHVGADLIVSTVQRTAFGVHRDSASNFSYVVSGRKRMLVWPQEALAQRTDLRCDGPMKNVFIDQLDYSSFRDQAIVLEGTAGDMLYWPASYWHVGESTGEPSMIFSIPFYLQSATYRMAIEYYQRKLADLEG